MWGFRILLAQRFRFSRGSLMLARAYRAKTSLIAQRSIWLGAFSSSLYCRTHRELRNVGSRPWVKLLRAPGPRIGGEEVALRVH